MLDFNIHIEMKKINYTLILFIIFCTTLNSCKKFLEKEPIGRTGKITLFETVNGAKLAINGSYNQMISYYKDYFGLYADISSDNLIRNSKTNRMLQQFNFQSSPGDDEFAVGNIWEDIYGAINGANNIISSIPGLKDKFPDQTKTLDSIYGQALVMRALFHFDVSRVYAQPYNFTADGSHLGVPVLLKTPSPGEVVPRKTMKEVYAQIIADLNESLPYLQQNANHHTQAAITYQAALGLLSRVYLYKGDWAQSVSYANMVINDNAYELANANNYKASFITYPAATASPKVEVIFQLNNATLSASALDVFSMLSDATAAQYTATTKILNMYDEDDIRFKTMFTKPKTGDNLGKSLTTKYGDGVVSPTGPLTIKILRLSELYLNRAEANWNLQKYSEAAEDIRIISQRAHPERTITITYSSNDDLYKQIANERNRELCFENHRLFDLVRRKENLQRSADCNATTCSLTYPNTKFVLPISIKELEANKAMIQNPGYN